jgi:hypothetical protein
MDKHLKIAQALAKLMDGQFKILGIRFGLDPLIGLIPGIGDFLSLCLSGYILYIGFKMRIPQTALFKMVRNLLFDFVIGSLPVLGDIADVIYKANFKNLEILKQYTALSVVEGEIVL